MKRRVFAGSAGVPFHARVCRHSCASPSNNSWPRISSEIVRELVELLSIPNVAADRDNVRRNASLLRDLLRKRGFTAEILETDGNPLVFAELRVPGAQRTLLFYAHYDGQPVDPKGWNQASPFTPVLRTRGSKTAGRRFRISWRCSNSRPRRGSTPARPPMTRRPSSRCSRRSTRSRR